MEITELIAVVSVTLAFVSFATQLFLSRQQTRGEAIASQYDRTQALILRTIDDPEFIKALKSTSMKNEKYRRIRQLWLNHVEVFFRQRHLFKKGHWKSTLIDMRDFMSMPAMEKHWGEYRRYYAKDFQKFLDREVYQKKAEASTIEAPPGSSQASST